ncbi:MAG: AAA family ATPase, partial [Bacteroidales bacterium]
MKEDNPFSPVYDSRYFCDRNEEIKRLQTNFYNGLNTVIHSLRRLGKTALIRHLFHQLEAENAADTIYVDLFATGKMQDLISLLAEKVLQKYHRKNLLQGIQQVLKGLNPSVSFAPDGTPFFNLQLNEAQHELSLRQIFDYLENRKKRVFIAFDEFQEIGTYPEKAEALLRTHIQELRNTGFIFSGSTGHIIHEMFLGPKRPFYQQAEVLVLGKINREAYRSFIIDTFNKHKKKMEPEAV